MTRKESGMGLLEYLIKKKTKELLGVVIAVLLTIIVGFYTGAIKINANIERIHSSHDKAKGLK